MPDIITKYGIYRTADGDKIFICGRPPHESWVGISERELAVPLGDCNDIRYFSDGKPLLDTHSPIVAYDRPYWEDMPYENGINECANGIAYLTSELNRQSQLLKDILEHQRQHTL